MKIYLVRRKKTNIRWFDNEKDLSDFLINAPERVDSYNITTINSSIESEMSGDIVLDLIKKKNKIDSKISISLGDVYATKVNRLIESYEILAKRTPWNPKRMTDSALKVYEKLTTTPPTEKDFKKIGASNLRYLTYCVSDSVEWYKNLLDVYPLIKKLGETCVTEYVDPVTYGTSWRGHRTPDKMIKNFEIAKKSMK